MKTLTQMIVTLMAILFMNQLNAQTENLAVVSADKMNVLYIGIDNPLSIAVPGIESSKLKVTIKNGIIKGSNGKYVVKVTQGTEAVIEVAAEIKPGETKKMGSYTFRIKRIPDPTASLGKFTQAEYIFSKGELLLNPGLTVMLNLPFDIDFEITSFSLTFEESGKFVTLNTPGNKFSKEMLDKINEFKDDSRIMIEKINVTGPDAAMRTLAPILIRLSKTSSDIMKEGEKK
jgi:gliding motility-associated protein GldM